MNEHTVSWLMIDDGWLLVVRCSLLGLKKKENCDYLYWVGKHVTFAEDATKSKD
jgi:hypothetical protein